MSINVTLNSVVYPVPTPGNVGWGASLTTYLRAIATAINGIIAGTQALTQPDVTAPTLLNSWADAGAPYEATGYWKDSLGVVHLQGSVADGTPGAASVIFTLPSGYRPSATQSFSVPSIGAFGQCDIQADGDVIALVGSGVSFSLAGITFRPGVPPP